MALQTSLWAAGLAAHLLLLLVLVVRGHARRFPWFTALIVFYLLRSVIPQLPMTRHLDQASYVRLFWGFELGDILLRVLVLAELLWRAFQNSRISRGRIVAWSVAAIAAAAVPTVLMGPLPASQVWAAFAKGNLLVAFLSLALLAALIATRRSTGLSWRSAASRIAHGLAFYAVVFLVLEALRLWAPGAASFHSGHHATYFHYWMQLSAAGAYLLAIMYWAVGLWFTAPESARPTVAASGALSGPETAS